MWPYIRMTLKGLGVIAVFCFGAYLIHFLPWWTPIVLFILAAAMWLGGVMEDE